MPAATITNTAIRDTLRRHGRAGAWRENTRPQRTDPHGRLLHTGQTVTLRRTTLELTVLDFVFYCGAWHVQTRMAVTGETRWWRAEQLDAT